MSAPFLLARRLTGAKGILQHSVKARNFSVTPAINAGYWNKDWRPATEPPETEEGKRAAAKKYGLIPEDYETFVSDGTGYGDYPKLETISADSRDPTALYDFPELKRNYGEPLHVDCDVMGEDRVDVSRRLPLPLWKMYVWFLGTMATTWILFQASQYVRVGITPAMPRQTPFDGRKYYTFELEDAE